MTLLPAQQSLSNFFESVQFHNPALAMRMSDDIRTVALYGITNNKEPGYKAVIRLRDLAEGLPVVYGKILDNAIEELGYSLETIYRETSVWPSLPMLVNEDC